MLRPSLTPRSISTSRKYDFSSNISDLSSDSTILMYSSNSQKQQRKDSSLSSKKLDNCFLTSIQQKKNLKIIVKEFIVKLIKDNGAKVYMLKMFLPSIQEKYTMRKSLRVFNLEEIGLHFMIRLQSQDRLQFIDLSKSNHQKFSIIFSQVLFNKSMTKLL